MKKILFAIALGAITVVACNKETEIEKELDNPTPIGNRITLSASGEAFTEMDMNGSSTKGTLNAAGNFLWADGDQIGVRLYKGNNYNGTWTYGSDSYDAWDATFALDSGYDGQSNGKFTSTTTITDEYVNWGYAAFYPKFNNHVDNADSKVYFELKKVYENYTSNTSLMPMVASLGDGSDGLKPADISFKHVGAGIRVTLKDVPANANQASLTVAGKNIANGDNHTAWFGVNPANAGTEAIAATDGNGENTVYLKFATASDKRDITFIFPLPTVDLSGGIIIKLYSGSEYNEFWSKTAHPVAPKTPLPTLGRGDLLDMPELTVGEWKKLGVGKFIDNQLWATMGFVDHTYDEVGFVDVVIEQNRTDNTKYRIINPYGQAADYLALIGLTQDDAHSDYLNFTIASNGAVTFESCVTGFVKGGVNYSIKQSPEGLTAKDHLVLGEYTNPSVVEIAPDYFDGGVTTRQMTRSEHTNAVRIIFPSIVNSATGSTTLSGNSYFGSGMTYTNNAAKMSVYVSSKSLFEYYNQRWDYGYSESDGVQTKSTNKTASTGNLTSGNLGVNTSFFTTSGILYLYWYTYTSDGTLLMEGCRRFYYLIPNDGSALTKTFTAPTAAECTAAGSSKTPNFYYNSTYFSEPSAYSMTLAVSDDLTKGNVMVTNFAGVSGKAYGYYNASNTFFTLFINEPFCTVSGTDFYLREYYPNVGTGDGQDYRGTARFKLNGIYYGGVNNGIACWGGYFGLYTGKNTGEGGTAGIYVAPFFNIE